MRSFVKHNKIPGLTEEVVTLDQGHRYSFHCYKRSLQYLESFMKVDKSQSRGIYAAVTPQHQHFKYDASSLCLLDFIAGQWRS